MYRVTASCIGLSDQEGTVSPDHILAEFKQRPWHQKPRCTWQESKLILVVENDYDHDGAALLDEYWDAVHACVNWSGSIRFEVSVETLDGKV